MRRRALLYENDLQAHIPVYFWVLNSAILHCLDSFDSKECYYGKQNHDACFLQRSVLRRNDLHRGRCTYDGKGATGGKTDPQTGKTDEKINVRDNGFTRDGYTFVTWNTQADCKGNVTNAFYHAGMIFWNAASTISSFGISAVMSLGIIYF